MLDNTKKLWYTLQCERKRETPDLMACSRIMHGNCSRCGKVGATHFAKPRAANSEEQERKQIQHAFFQKRQRFVPSKAQLRLMLDGD